MINTTEVISAVAITTKNGHSAVVINNEYTVSTSTDGRYFVAHNVAKGRPTDISTQPFIYAFKKYFTDQAAADAAKIEAAKLAETTRISALRERIKKCETPNELADEFGLTKIETAAHWSDLYKGRSKFAVRICNREDAEIMEMAIDILNISGGYGEARHRNGESHSTFSRGYSGLSDYQIYLLAHFSGDQYFYKSQESEKDFYCEQIAEAAGEGDIEKVKSLMSDYEDIEAGYYDCNGNLEMSDEQLNDPDRSGYNYDIYSYSFAFRFEFIEKFNDKEEEDEE